MFLVQQLFFQPAAHCISLKLWADRRTHSQCVGWGITALSKLGYLNLAVQNRCSIDLYYIHMTLDWLFFFFFFNLLAV